MPVLLPRFYAANMNSGRACNLWNNLLFDLIVIDNFFAFKCKLRL